MLIDYLILLILVFLPIYYRYSLWLYCLESVEYDVNSFFDILKTTEWKNVIFNFWFFIEIILLIFTIFLIINPPFEIIYYNIFFYFLILQNIFVLWKIFRKKMLIGTMQKTNLITILLLLFFFCLGLFVINYIQIWQILYPYLILTLLFSPILSSLIIFFIPKKYKLWKT